MPATGIALSTLTQVRLQQQRCSLSITESKLLSDAGLQDLIVKQKSRLSNIKGYQAAPFWCPEDQTANA
jgi:hypothetical protein